MLLHSGKPLSLVDLDTTHVRLRNALWDKGYADALIVDTIQVQDSARTAEVTIKVNPRWVATVESVTVHGDSVLSPDIVQKMITLKPGNIYKRDDVIESQRALYNSNLFRRATIVLPPRGDSAKLIDINVNESRMHAVKLSAGFNTIDFIQTEGTFTNYNFLGNARRLDMHLVVSNLLAPALNGTGIFRDVLADNGLPGDSSRTYLKPTYQASIDFTERWFGDPRNTVGLGVFSHRSSVPGIFVDKGYGASISFSRALAPRTPLSLVYRYELTQVQAGDVYFCVNYGVCEQNTIGLLRNRNTLSPVSLDYYMERTDDQFNPTEGYTARADLRARLEAHALRLPLQSRIRRGGDVSADRQGRACRTPARRVGEGAVVQQHDERPGSRRHPASAQTLLRRRRELGAGLRRESARPAHSHDRSGEADSGRRVHERLDRRWVVRSERSLRFITGSLERLYLPSHGRHVADRGKCRISISVSHEEPAGRGLRRCRIRGLRLVDVHHGEGGRHAGVRRPVSFAGRADSRGSRVQTVGDRSSSR